MLQSCPQAQRNECASSPRAVHANSSRGCGGGEGVSKLPKWPAGGALLLLYQVRQVCRGGCLHVSGRATFTFTQGFSFYLFFIIIFSRHLQ